MDGKKKVLFGLASLTLFDIAAATAADLPLKAPPPPPAPIYDWSGFYIGAHAGYRWADANFSGPASSFDTGLGGAVFAPRNHSFSPNGGIFGAQAGYNFMLTPSVLAGVEGDWSWASAKGSVANTFFDRTNSGDGFIFRNASELKLTWQATIRGRLGIVNGPWLFYGTGGVAFIQAKWNESATLAFVDFPVVETATWTAKKTLTGYVVGGGIEYLYSPNWIGRLEYLYENFGDFSVPHGLGVRTGTVDVGSVHKLRVAISYKFRP